MASSADQGSRQGQNGVAEVLAEIEQWPVGVAAAVVVTADGTQSIGDVDHVFQLASVSKLVTAYATLMAIEEGAFELDDRVSDIAPDALPDWGGADGDDGDQPTIRELLAHASGMAFDSKVAERPAQDRRIYSSAGYEVLADVIATATGMPFPDYVRMGLCEPLGINIKVEGSAGHGFSASATAVAALAADMIHPRLLAEETLSQAFEPQFPALAGIVPGYGRQNPCPWGLGWEIHGAKRPHWVGESMPEDVAGHFGQSGTFVWAHRETERAVVVLTDTPFGSWAKKRWAAFNDRLWAALQDTA